MAEDVLAELGEAKRKVVQASCRPKETAVLTHTEARALLHHMADLRARLRMLGDG